MNDKLVLNIDGAVIESKEELHNTIAWQLSLPAYYGHNLDALWDVLSTWTKPLIIEVTHTAQLKGTLEEYADALLDLLRDVKAENGAITLSIS